MYVIILQSVIILHLTRLNQNRYGTMLIAITVLNSDTYLGNLISSGIKDNIYKQCIQSGHSVTPAGSVHKSMGVNMVRMWLQLKKVQRVRQGGNE